MKMAVHLLWAKKLAAMAFPLRYPVDEEPALPPIFIPVLFSANIPLKPPMPLPLGIFPSYIPNDVGNSPSICKLAYCIIYLLINVWIYLI